MNKLAHTTKQTAPFPSDTSIAILADLLVKQSQKQKRLQSYAPVKEVLSLLGLGAAISAAILLPKSATLIKPLMKQSPNWDSWKHFNTSYLQRTLRRLHAQKIVEITEINGTQVVSLTKHGKRKILKFNLETLSVDIPKQWDRKWRLALYDIPKNNRHTRDIVRQSLRALGFYAIQESVFIYPYPCFDQIEFLREYYGTGAAIQYMVVEHIEDDAAYKIYFNLS